MSASADSLNNVMIRYLIILISTIIVLLSSCNSKNEEYVINGIFPKEAKVDGRYIYLYSIFPDGSFDEKIDSTIIEHNKFLFRGLAKEELELSCLVTKNYRTLVIPEEGEITADMVEVTATGTPLNDKLYSFSKQLDSIFKMATNSIVFLEEKVLDDSLKQAINYQAEYTKIINKLRDERQYITTTTYLANEDNVVGEIAFYRYLLTTPKYDDFKQYEPSLCEKIRSSQELKKYYSYIESLRATSVGAKFTEVSGEDTNKEPIRLSNFVGNGKYTLVEFWASWCEPCRTELEAIKEIKKKYAERLEIVGVNIRDSFDEFKNAIVDMKISSWHHIFKDCNANSLYGIKGIPQIVLIDPQGKIVARDLRDKELLKAVDQALAKKK